MGIVLTKYEHGNDVKFDVSKFDYYYDSDTFGADSATDFEGILLEHGDYYSVYNASDIVDSMGHITAITATETKIYGMFQDITIKDRKIHNMGLAIEGNRKFFFKPAYSKQSGGVVTSTEIKEGDIIKDNHLYSEGTSTGQFRIVKILGQWWEPGTEVYRVAIVQSINLDGS